MDKKPESGAIRRRGFFTTIGAGVVGAAVSGKAAVKGPAEPPEAPAPLALNLTINGRKQRVTIEPHWTLLFVLRDQLGLTGTKVGCEHGECGVCTVLIDGLPRYACLTLAAEVEGCEVTTIEGLMQGEQLGRVQKAFVEEDGMQCGFCTPGQVMAAEGLLRKNSNPSITEIREGISGNICRCGAYNNIAKSVLRAAEMAKGGGA